jgi:hypothetical protein
VHLFYYEGCNGAFMLEPVKNEYKLFNNLHHNVNIMVHSETNLPDLLVFFAPEKREDNHGTY